MSGNRENIVLGINPSGQTSSPLQMHNFMPMPTSTVHGDHQERQEARNACFMNQLKQNMQSFWRERLTEIYEAPSDVRGQHKLPLARIKKVMKSDEHVKMISTDTPVVFAKACEMFIMELTLRAWMHTQENKRRTLQRNDVANAIRDEDILLFLKDIVPMEMRHQGAQLAIENHDHGVYVPLPIQGPTMMPQNYPEEATGGRPVAIDHRFASFQMNLQYYRNPSSFERYQEMRQNPRFPPPPPPAANRVNPYLDFKER